MGEMYGIEIRKKAGQVLEDHSKTIRKTSNTKASTTWWESDNPCPLVLMNGIESQKGVSFIICFKAEQSKM